MASNSTERLVVITIWSRWDPFLPAHRQQEGAQPFRASGVKRGRCFFMIPYIADSTRVPDT